MSLAERIAALEASINARAPRERLLLAAALAVVVLLVWDVVVRAPLADQARADERRIEQLTGQIDSFESSRAELRRQLGEDGGDGMVGRLRGQIERVDAELAERTLRVISPRQMVTVLRDVLDDASGLSLMALRNLGSEPVLQPAGDEGDGTPRVFRHRVEVVVRGDYFALLAYLERLEGLEWQFQWDALAIETVDYPQAEATLSLSTLSLAEDWVGV